METKLEICHEIHLDSGERCVLKKGHTGNHQRELMAEQMCGDHGEWWCHRIYGHDGPCALSHDINACHKEPCVDCSIQEDMNGLRDTATSLKELRDALRTAEICMDASAKALKGVALAVDRLFP